MSVELGGHIHLVLEHHPERAPRLEIHRRILQQSIDDGAAPCLTAVVRRVCDDCGELSFAWQHTQRVSQDSGRFWQVGLGSFESDGVRLDYSSHHLEMYSGFPYAGRLLGQGNYPCAEASYLKLEYRILQAPARPGVAR